MSPTSDVVRGLDRDDAERWRALAATAPATARWRLARRVLLVAIGVPGLLWLAIIGWWALRAAWPAFWVVIAAHLLAIGVAVGPPVRARAADLTGDYALRLRAGHAARARRLAVLCGALIVEMLGNVAWSAGYALLVAPPFRLGPGFTTAFATLWFNSRQTVTWAWCFSACPRRSVPACSASWCA